MILPAALAALLAPLQALAPPSQAELEDALLRHQIRIVTYPQACRDGRRRAGCLVPPRRIKVRAFDCPAAGDDAESKPLLFCRVTFIQAGGSLANVQANGECVPLRRFEIDMPEHGIVRSGWEVALVDAKDRCAGAR